VVEIEVVNGIDPGRKPMVPGYGSRPTGRSPLPGPPGPFLVDPSGRYGRRRSHGPPIRR
jgi:hypothetical protein